MVKPNLANIYHSHFEVSSKFLLSLLYDRHLLIYFPRYVNISLSALLPYTHLLLYSSATRYSYQNAFRLLLRKAVELRSQSNRIVYNTTRSQIPPAVIADIVEASSMPDSKSLQDWQEFVADSCDIIKTAVNSTFRKFNHGYAPPEDVDEVTEDIFKLLLNHDCRVIKMYDESRSNLMTWLTPEINHQVWAYLQKKENGTDSKKQ